jgi:coenzyme PQQ precursor peptide PqqA
VFARITKSPSGFGAMSLSHLKWRNTMRTWSKPQVREQEVGLEVTSYMPAEIDII